MNQIKFKLTPIFKMLGVTVLVAIIIVAIHIWFKSHPCKYSWILADLYHIPQFLIPFLMICYLSKGNPKEYGFNLNEESFFTHKRMAIIGVSFGILMSVRYIPQVVEHALLDIPYPVTLANVLGNMSFQWIVVGISEETMFRGLIQTYLMKNLDGYIKMFGHDLHIGTVLGAVFWGGFHFINILIMPLRAVIFFVILTTGIGLLMGYAYQRTGSLLTTIIIHNTLFGTQLTLGYIIYWLLTL